MNTRTEYLTEENSRVVRLSRALCSMLEDCEHRFGTKTVSDTLDMILRPVLRTIRKTHGEINVTFSENYLEKDLSFSITLTFTPKQKITLRGGQFAKEVKEFDKILREKQ